MQKKIGVLFMLFQFLTFSVVAQELIVFSESKSYSFKYELEEDKDTVTNFFVTEIAKGLPQNPTLVSCSITFDVETKLVKLPKNKYRIDLLLTNVQKLGDYKYRGFDVSAIIFPKLVDVNIQWSDLNSSSKWNEQFASYFIDLYTTDIFWSKSITDSTKSASYIINKADVEFALGAGQKDEFVNIVKAIDAYYDSGFLLDEIQAKLDRIQLDNANMLLIYNIQLKNIEKELATVKPANFYQDRNQQNYDPIGLGARHLKMQKAVDSLRDGLKHKMTTLDYTYYEQGIDYLEKGDTANAESVFLRSIRINPYYSPSYYHLAQINMHNGVADTAVMYIRTILKDLKPDYELKKKTIALADYCAEKISTKALAYTKEEAFNEAVSHLDVALLLCDSTPFVECSERVSFAMAEAKYGLYNSYLSVAKTALEHNLKLVEGYLDLAYKYQQANQSYIISSSEVDLLYMKLIDKYEEIATQFVSNGEYGYAISYADKIDNLLDRLTHLKIEEDISKKIKTQSHEEIYAKMIYKSLALMEEDGALSADLYLEDAIAYQKSYSDFIPTDIGTDTIKKRLKIAVYRQHIQQVERFKEAGRIQMAVEHIRKAKKIEEEFLLPSSAKLNALLQELMVPMLISDLRYPNTKSWGRHYKSAQSALDDVLRKKTKYKIVNAELDKAIEATDYYIRITSCTDLKVDYKDEIANANQQMRSGDYLSASKYWNKALSIARENPYCGLDTAGLLRYFDSYSAVIKYQYHKLEAELAFQKVDYDLAVLEYWEAQKLADSIGLKKYRIYHIHFNSWVDGKIKESKFMESLIKVLSNEGEFHLVMDLLAQHVAQNNGVILTDLHKAFLNSLAQHDVRSSKLALKDLEQKYFQNRKDLSELNDYYKYYYLKASDKKLSAGLFRLSHKIK
jgi:hypothetical protein